MGDTGQFSRLLSPLYGASLVFASSTKGMESAPGQLPVRDYEKIYHVHELNNQTTYTGLLGSTADYPAALTVFNTLFKKQKCNYLYFPFLIKDIKDFFRVFREKRFAGVSIAYPYQQIVGRALDRTGYPVRKTGLVTLAVKEDGMVRGYNSDVNAFQSFFDESLPVAGKRCAVLGSAYRWRSLLYVMKKMKAEITILSEDKTQAKRLAQSVGCGYDHVQQLGRLDFDMIFCHSLVEKQIDMERLTEYLARCRCRHFIDLGDFSGGHSLEKHIKQSGCRFVNGLPVLQRKIAYEFKLFTGREANRDILAASLRACPPTTGTR
jgi:shikimate 5-dehydrogenase